MEGWQMVLVIFLVAHIIVATAIGLRHLFLRILRLTDEYQYLAIFYLGAGHVWSIV
jgi:hypothetical protein